MGKKDSEKKPEDNFLERDIDPAVASRVDKIMNEEPANDSPQPASSNDEQDAPAQAAPLLPSDKLPTKIKVLEDNPKADNPQQSEAIPEITSTDNEERYEHDSVGLEDPATDKAVDEIVGEEADRILAIEDAKAELLADGDAVLSESFFARLKNGLSNFWAHSSVRIIALLLFLSLLAVAAIIPVSRYFVLNALGVRASTSMIILDGKTDQPLKDVEVTLQNQTVKTDKQGLAGFSEIKLGASELVIKKPAFASVVQNHTFGWGSNPLGDIDLTSVGSRYTFELTDFLSGKPITKAEAISGQYSAVADKKGTIVLVLEDDSGKDVEIEISSENYRSEKLRLSAGNKDPQKISMVPLRKHAFISKRSGTYDLFAVDADGKNLKKILPGTGSEKEESLVLVNHPDKGVAAFVSTRGNLHNAQGNLQSVLTVADLNSAETKQASESASIQIVDFAGDKLVYVRQGDDAKEGSDSRFQLVSYDLETDEETVLASASYFNDVLLAKDMVYYSPAGKPKKASGLFKVNPDGSGSETILAKEAWNIFRAEYNKLHIAFAQEWYEHDLDTGQLDRLDGAPATDKSRIYVTSPDGKRSLWVDERDGKGVLLVYDVSANKDRVLQTVAGLRNPVRWLDNDHIIYRISNESETADYVLSLSGGEAKKIEDVTNTAGLDGWYYF